jgi:hypothetical protein
VTKTKRKDVKVIRALTIEEIEYVSGGTALPSNGSVCKYPAGPNGEPGCGTVPKHPPLGNALS